MYLSDYGWHLREHNYEDATETSKPWPCKVTLKDFLEDNNYSIWLSSETGGNIALYTTGLNVLPGNLYQGYLCLDPDSGKCYKVHFSNYPADKNLYNVINTSVSKMIQYSSTKLKEEIALAKEFLEDTKRMKLSWEKMQKDSK